MAAVYRTPPQIASTNHTQLADIFGSPLGLDGARLQFALDGGREGVDPL